ncbi:MAG: protein translocase subunit SecD [Coxiellaceae bacterium]|nr:protein translocase subunit SecD [Coxiellaceae bacterium]
MNRYPLWRYILIVVLIIVGVLYALPNIYGSNPAIQISPKNAAALSAQVMPQVKQALNQQNLSYISVTQQQKNALLIRFHDTTTQLKAQEVLRAVLGNKYSIAPNIAPLTPSWLRAIGAKQMRKGLDLQGGIHFLMAVDTNALLKQQQSSDMHSIGNTLREKAVRYSGLTGLGKQGIRIDFRAADPMASALALLNKNFPNYHWKDSNDNGNFSIAGELTQPALVKLQKYAVDQNMTILRNRVNALGVSEPIVVRQGSSNISIDLPGIQDSARAKELLGKVATIQLHMVDVQHDAEQAAQSGVVPFGSKLYKDEDGRPVLLKTQTVLKGQSIVSASAQIGENGKPIVAIRLGGSGVTLFNRITAQNVGKPMATVMVETKIESHLVDGKVVNTPKQFEKVINTAVIQSALGNSFQIENLQSQAYSRNLALLLRSGAYTAPVVIVQERIVGPSLGKENIKKGELSTLVGTLLIVLFMAIYYRVFGLVADVALILNLVFIVAILSIIGATLTLPGIAAIVLTLGMAVDANVLINERIREELRLGMSPQAAIAAGYGRAFMTIVDSNVTTLIVAVVLVTISSSSVKGFAINLIIGLLTSMVTAMFFTRAIINLTYGTRNVKKLSIGI